MTTKTVQTDQPLKCILGDWGKLDKTSGSSILSPVYHDERDGLRTEWQLVLYPGGVRAATEGDISSPSVYTDCCYYTRLSVYLQMVRCNYKAVGAKFKVSINPDRTLSKDCSEERLFHTLKDNRKVGWREMHSCGTCSSRPPPTKLNGTCCQKVKVSCQIYELRVIDRSERLDVMPVKSDLIDQLRSFYEQCKLTDYGIIVGGKSFQVHKALFAARSPVIAAMFEHDTKEKASNRLEIAEFTQETVEQFIKFIYSGELPDLGEEAADLLAMAEKYDVKYLKGECEVALARSLDASNAAAVLHIADLHRASHLKKFTLQFIKDNVKAVIEVEEKWKSLPRYLIDEFIKFVFPKEFGN